MLILADEFLLLTLQEKKGVVSHNPGQCLSLGLSCAILSELVLANKIRVDEKSRVIVTDSSPGLEDLLEKYLASIRNTRRPRKVSHWIEEFRKNPKELRNRLFERLISKGILKQEDGKYAWVIPYATNAKHDVAIKYWVKEHLRAVVIGGEPFDSRSAALLELLLICDFLEFVFTVDEIKTVRKQLDSLLNESGIGKEELKCLKAISAMAQAHKATHHG